MKVVGGASWWEKVGGNCPQNAECVLNVHLCSPPLAGVGDERAGDIYLSHEERIAGSQTSGTAAGDKMIFGLGSGSSSIALVRVCSSLVSVCQGIFVQILSFICLDSRLLTLYCLFIRAFKQYLVRKEVIWLVRRNLYFHIFNKIVYNYFFYFWVVDFGEIENPSNPSNFLSVELLNHYFNKEDSTLGSVTTDSEIFKVFNMWMR